MYISVQVCITIVYKIRTKVKTVLVQKVKLICAIYYIKPNPFKKTKSIDLIYEVFDVVVW